MRAIPLGDDLGWTVSRTLTWYVAIDKGATPAWADGTTRHVYSVGAVPHTAKPATVRYVEDRMALGAIGEASTVVDARKIGGIAAAGTMDFEIWDGDNALEALIGSGIYYDGRAVSLWVAYKSSATGSTDLQVWSGVIQEVERDPVDDSVLFRCQTSDARYSKECPPKTWGLVPGTDPSGAKGRPRQLVFGAHAMIPTFMMSPATDITGTYLAGNHGPSYAFADAALSVGLRSVSGAVFGDEGLIQATGGTAEILNTVSTILATGRVVMPYQISGKLGIRFDINFESFQKGGNYEISGVDWTPIIDNNDATYISRNHKDGSFFGGGPTGTDVYWTANAKLPYISTAGTIQKISPSIQMPKIYLGYRVLFTATPTDAVWRPMSSSLAFWRDRNEPVTGSGNYYYAFTFPARPFTDNVQDAAYSAQTIYFNGKSAASGSGVDIPLETLADLSGGLVGVQVSWKYEGNSGSPDVMNMKVCEMRGIRVYADVDYPTDAGVFVSAEGYKDTATSADWLTGVAGALIENPAHVAAWLARYVSGAGVALTPRADFQAVAALRPGWRLASVVGERSTTNDVIGDVAEAARFYVWCDALGRYRAFTAGRVTRPTLELERGDVVGGALKDAKQTPLADVASSFLFLYSLNTITGNYDKSLAVSPTSLPAGMAADLSAVCTAAAERYAGGSSVPITIETDWIRDDATAILWADAIVRWRASRRWVISFEVDAVLLVLEPGDTLSFATSQWLGIPAALVSRQYVVTGIEISPSKNRATITAVETG